MEVAAKPAISKLRLVRMVVGLGISDEYCSQTFHTIQLCPIPLTSDPTHWIRKCVIRERTSSFFHIFPE